MRLFILATLIALTAAATPLHTPQDQGEKSTQALTGSIHFVATSPAEAGLVAPSMTPTHEEWLRAIHRAERSFDLAFFYASDRGPNGALPTGAPTKLTEIVHALEAATKRGVAVRMITDGGFAKTYPALLLRLDELDGATVRKLDMRALTGGVMHAKYFIADGLMAYAGSANFDWRSLEHIQELGVGVNSRHLAQALAQVFALDWHLAGGAALGDFHGLGQEPGTFPVSLFFVRANTDMGIGFEAKVTPVFSPKELLPPHAEWDLPHILKQINGAKERLWIQVMTFRMKGWDGERFTELEDAILGAAKRGVDVRLLVADWGKRKGTIEGLQELTARDGIQVRMITVPEHATGHIPFARVIHAKFMVVDMDRAWVGSSNWEKGYFYESRNVGFLIEGFGANDSLAAFHSSNWKSAHAYPVDPEATYEVPAFGERD